MGRLSPSQIATDIRQEAARLIVIAQRIDPAPATTGPPSPGVTLIGNERTRQVQEEGFTHADDAAYRGSELAWAAYCYLERAAQDKLPQGDPSVPHVWPLGRSQWRPKDSKIRNLTIAAALIAAELDRLWEEGERA